MKKIFCSIILMALVLPLACCKGGGSTNVQSVSSTTIVEETGVTVSKDAFPENAEVKVEKLEQTDEIAKAIPLAKSIVAYDISAFLDKQKVQPSGEVEVTFPIPSDYDAATHNIEVYYVSDSGEIEKIEVTVSESGVVAKLSHFSVYAVVLVEKPKLNIAVLFEGGGKVDYKVEVVDGHKYFSSNVNVQFTYNQNETWRSFVERNKNSGFEIDKDFYGKRDAIYYTHNKIRYEIADAINFNIIKPDDVISLTNYAAKIPHRETLQGEWFYDISNEATESFDRQGKVILLDIPQMTYTITHVTLTKLSENNYTRTEDVIASGKYTSSDGDNLGATLTFDNGYILKTTRSDTHVATLVKDGKSITAKTQSICRFYEF